MGNRWSKSNDFQIEYAVIVHVYELGPTGMGVSMMKAISGMGVYHTGTEIRPVSVVLNENAPGYRVLKKNAPVYSEKDGVEYAFGGADSPGTGVWYQEPKVLPPGFANDTGRYKQSVEMGTCQMTSKQLRAEIQQLQQEWPAVHIASSFCHRLTVISA
jgi:hypothetical protein